MYSKKNKLTLEEMKRMREVEHKSYAEIGKECGVTRQRVQQIFSSEAKKKKRKNKYSDNTGRRQKAGLYEKIKYQRIREWLKKNDIRVLDFCKKVDGVDEYKPGYGSYKSGRFLTGQSRGSIGEICAILNETHLKFEDAFKEELEAVREKKARNS